MIGLVEIWDRQSGGYMLDNLRQLCTLVAHVYSEWVQAMICQ